MAVFPRHAHWVFSGASPHLSPDDLCQAHVSPWAARHAFTLSGNYKVGGLMIIPELRFDKGSEDNFFDKDGEVTDSMLSATLAAVYKF
jgi:hypothetical protein